MYFQLFDVVVVPLPFADCEASKRRPLVLTRNACNQQAWHSEMAIISGARPRAGPVTTSLKTWTRGLSAKCVTRLGLFRLDHRLMDAKRSGVDVQVLIHDKATGGRPIWQR